MYLEQKFVWLYQLALLLSTTVLSELCDVEGDERVTEAANRADVIQICIEEDGIKNWTFVCFPNWGNNEAEVYCRRAGYTQLDFVGIGAYQVVTGGARKLKNVECDSDSKSILECSYETTTEDCKYVADVQCRQCDRNSQCNSGTCQDGVCECESTCLNGGFCYLGDCVCPTGYSGTICSIQELQGKKRYDTFETKAQTLISTTVIETTPVTTTTMNSSSQPTATDNIMIRTRPPLIRNITTLSPSNTRPSPPVILPQYLAYGLPMGVILIIIVIALVVSIIVCLCCSRRMRNKAKDPESDIIAINTRNMTPENELANEPTYSSISETINSCKPPTDHNNNNNINHRVMTNRSENVYSQVESSMSLSEVTTPNGMIQNVLYNVFATETDYTNNMYHVLAADDVTDSSFEKHYKSMVGGEVINPSVYEKIPSLQSIEVQRDKRESKIYMEPPKNLSELKEMLTVSMYELRNEDVEMGEEFASGQFGVVYRGKYRTSVGDVPVAIKTLKETVDTKKDLKVAFMREAAILAQFHHPNVLRLIGIVTTQQPWMMITELLKTELRQLLLQITCYAYALFFFFAGSSHSISCRRELQEMSNGEVPSHLKNCSSHCQTLSLVTSRNLPHAHSSLSPLTHFELLNLCE